MSEARPRAGSSIPVLAGSETGALLNDTPWADTPPPVITPPVGSEEPVVDLIALDEALSRLAARDEQLCRLVELRYFGGLSVEETAEVLRISPKTVRRDWNMAKAWLHRALMNVG